MTPHKFPEPTGTELLSLIPTALESSQARTAWEGFWTKTHYKVFSQTRKVLLHKQHNQNDPCSIQQILGCSPSSHRAVDLHGKQEMEQYCSHPWEGDRELWVTDGCRNKGIFLPLWSFELKAIFGHSSSLWMQAVGSSLLNFFSKAEESK